MQARPISSCGVRPSVCVSVCLSVTFVDSVRRNKHIFKKFSPPGSQAILVFPHQAAWQYSDGNPPLTGVSNGGGVGNDSVPMASLRAVNTATGQVLSTRHRRTTVLQVATLIGPIASSKRRSLSSSSSSYICSKRQHTAIEKQVSRTDRHKVHLHLP